MRKLWALLLVCAISLPVSASQGGVNESISLDGTGIKTLDYDGVMRTNTTGSADFGVILQMEDGSNISNIRWVTQVCINTGVCYPPEESQMDRGDDGSFDSHLDTEPGYSYINWKFIIEMEDGSESQVPDVGFGWKVWSDCWYDNGSWGGDSTECQPDDSSFIPGFVTPLVFASISLATLMIRRE
jgi:hypothetical protein